MKNESDCDENTLNKKKLNNENNYKHTSFKDRIVSNRSRTIKKVSMKLRQQGEGISKVSKMKTIIEFNVLKCIALNCNEKNN